MMMGCAKIFPNAVASLQKFPGEVAGSFWGALIDKNDSEEQRQGTFPASHKHGPDEASISAAIVPGTQAPRHHRHMWRAILNTS